MPATPTIPRNIAAPPAAPSPAPAAAPIGLTSITSQSLPGDHSTSSGSLPPLSPTDHHLLTRLLALNEDLPALAAELATSPDAGAEAPRSPGLPLSPSLVPCALSLVPPPDLLSLLAWSTQPNIAAWLTHYHHLQDQHSRRLAITELRTLLKTSDNPIEKRRTATTLLRALDHKWPTEPRRAPVNPDRQGGARNPLRSSSGLRAPSIADFIPPRLPNLSSPPPRSSASSAFTPPASPPTPSITPSPSLTPTDLARALALDLSTGDILQTAATLAAISTPSLLSDPDTIIAQLEPFLALPASTPIPPPEYHKPTPPSRHACRIRLSPSVPSCLSASVPSSPTLTLNFARSHNAPWLLTGIDST